MLSQKSIWQAKRYLYKKLAKNGSLTSENIDFSKFFLEQKKTPIGQFFEVDQLVAIAIRGNTALTERMQVLNNRLEKINQIVNYSEKMSEINSIILERAELQTEYEQSLVENLESAYLLNESINYTNSIEAHKKNINRLSIKKMRGISFDENDLETLRYIATLCREEAGKAPSYALSLLPSCEQDDVILCEADREELGPQLEPKHLIAVDGFNQQDTQRGNQIKVFPNPTNDVVNIKAPNGNKGLIYITDLLGKKVYESNLNLDEITVLNHQLPQGIYIINIELENGSSHTEKLIVNK